MTSKVGYVELGTEEEWARHQPVRHWISVCPEHGYLHVDGDPVIRTTWIQARFDAVEHDIERHGRVLDIPWPELAQLR